MAELDYKKLPSDERIALWGGPSGAALGITDLDQPEADELNNVGGASGMLNYSPSVSWQDTELPGVTESDSTNEPSLADPATYTDFGPANYAGSLSMYLPNRYDDNSNNHSLVYDQTDTMHEILDFAVRIDGDKHALAPAADGDYISTSRQMLLSEQNPFNLEESIRRTVGMTGKGGFAHYTIVGEHVLVPDAPSDYAVGDKGRILVSVQGRDYTNALDFHSSNSEVVRVHKGGFYEVVGAGTTTIEVEDKGADTSTTIEVTVA